MRSAILALLFGALVIGAYAAACASGLDLGAERVEVRAVPAGARRPDGSFEIPPSFWSR